MLANNASIIGNINFVTSGPNSAPVNIIANGAVRITGGIGDGTGTAEINVSANGPLTLTGALNGTLAVVAGTSSITGRITGDLNVAHGATVSVTGGIGGDVSNAGGKVTITNSGIGGDLAILAGTASITGGVEGRVDVTAGTVNITGGVRDVVFVVEGSVTITGGLDESLGVLAGTVNITGGIGYNLAVMAGNVTITGDVDGETFVYGGAVKVNNTTITPATLANVSIPLDTLIPGSSASSPAEGWQFDGASNTLILAGIGKNYTLTGTAATGIGVAVTSAVTGTLTLQNAALDNNTAAGRALQIESEALRLAIAGTVTLASSAGEGIHYIPAGFPLIIDAASGATLNATAGAGFDGIYCEDRGLVLRGAGTLNFRGGDASDTTAWTGIYTPHGIIVKDSVTVNATGGNYTGTDVLDSGANDGIFCSALSIVGAAKVNAKGGNSLAADCYAGSGVIANGLVHVASTAAGALTATAGAGNEPAFGYGAGIGATDYDLHLTGPGETKATGDYALASIFNIFINSGKVTAEGKSTGYALYAGVVTIAGGNVTAKNTATTNHEYYGTLNHTGGTYNGTPISGGNNGGNTNPGPGNSGGGGGGGGAPTPLMLAALAALVTVRALRKK